MSNFKPWTEVVSGVVAVIVLLSAAGAAQAVVAWDEGTDGDLSSERLAPTSLILALGSNLLTATSVGGAAIDREYVTINLPANARLIEVLMVAYASTDGRAFIGVQSGATFTEPPTGTDPEQLLGYAHFGETDFDIGDDILPSIGEGPGSLGFIPPLAGGPYTFWIQQTSSTASATYTLNFVVAPEPGSASLIGVAAVLLAGVGRQRSRRAEQR